MRHTDSASQYELNACTPSREQTWLLHAAMSSGEQALQAWCNWREHIDLDSVDPASFRLLPIAYRNLVDMGQDDALLQRLKGVYRHTWYKNQILYRQAEEILAEFARLGIAPLLLKGAAMTERFYRDHGMRYMNDIDLMVPESDFEQAAAVLMARGWEPTLYSGDAMLWYHRHRFKHGCAFKHQGVEVDLHSHLLRFLPQDDAALWRTSLEGSWRGQPVYFLNDTDQLFHICVHGLRWSHAYLSWIPDALMILRSDSPDLSWDSLVEKATLTRTVPYLRNALSYLADEFQVPIPPDTLRALRSLPVSRVEKYEYRTMGQVPSGSPSYQLARLICQSCRYNASRHPHRQAIRFSPTAWIRFLYVHAYPPGIWRRSGGSVANGEAR